MGRVGEKNIPAMRNRAMGHDKLKQGSTAFVNVVSCVVYVCRAVIVGIFDTDVKAYGTCCLFRPSGHVSLAPFALQ